MTDAGYPPATATETLNERVYDTLMAAGCRALADEFSDANGAGS